jgi:hypothetical protein
MRHPLCHWLVVDFESSTRDPRAQLRTEYDGLTIHIQPHMDEYCDVMSTFVRPEDDLQGARLKLNRFLSAMAWKDDCAFVTRGSTAGGARAQDSENPRFNYLEKRRITGYVISRFDFEHLFVATNDRQRLALALYRDGLNSENEFYRFLSFYKIINILHSDSKDQMRWVNINIPNLKFEAAKRVQELAPKGDIGNYLYVQGRTAIAHAFSRPIRDPDQPGDRTEVGSDCVVVKALAVLLMENELGVPTLSKIFREHLFELSGFKEIIGEDLSIRLLRGEDIRREELPPIFKLSLRLRVHSNYECLEGIVFHPISCDGGILVLATNPEAQPTQVRLVLNFPQETLEFDLNAFSYNKDHWKFDNELGESYYRFLRDYYGNGCLEVFDCLSGERLSHKMAFIPMNIDFQRLDLHLEIQRSAFLRSRLNVGDAG